MGRGGKERSEGKDGSGVNCEEEKGRVVEERERERRVDFVRRLCQTSNRSTVKTRYQKTKH